MATRNGIILAGLAAAAALGWLAWDRLQPAGLPAGFASANGRIEATEIDIAALTGGRIAEITAAEGDLVKAGDLLVQMDVVQLNAQKRQAEAQLARIGLAEQMHELAGNLALGPQRLVEIARALATDPALLLLDEPAAGLRHHEKQALAAVLRQLKAEGMSLLLVEHDMDFVMGLADRIVVMEFGTWLMEGSPAEVQASPAVRAAYLGTEH